MSLPVSAPVFEHEFVVPESDIDMLGHVNNVAYVRWIQDVAVAHWRAVASDEEQRTLVWVVLRHEIDYRKAAFGGETLKARTWVGSAAKIRFERLTDIVRSGDETLLASARTIWCPLDRLTMRPVSVNLEVRAKFSAVEHTLRKSRFPDSSEPVPQESNGHS
ncbi:MAG: acyl-CoA thioesterase [Bryobacteraceae bacterium]|nr:acyl-CoA thioesterase [Bryobacteraceae bacterium]